MDLRKFPRRDVCAQQRVLSLSLQKQPVAHVVLSRNLSASGFCYKSGKPVEAGQNLLVYFDDSLLEDLATNKAGVIKVGKYFMAKSVWSKLVGDLSNPYYEIGCSFVGLEEGDDNKLNLFTLLINHDAAKRLGVSD